MKLKHQLELRSNAKSVNRVGEWQNMMIPWRRIHLDFAVPVDYSYVCQNVSVYLSCYTAFPCVQQVSPGDKFAQRSTLAHLTLAKLSLDDTETVSSSAIMDRFSMHCKRTKQPFLSLHSFDPNLEAFSSHEFFSHTEKGRERNEDDTKINKFK